ncbi:Endonuclease III [Methanimicrococcus hongohii]|uniref:Endonuclease III n=1 Tax=Methanimicrococcus hongohii TaxID=3028295 RepID=A0AA96ZSA6_9EURY|nr:endonuclease III [Methanimicrococcus sp. Hf6]WNY23209.1 Endonuclease III [Methanimicrococcus sp. Hf6]
MVKETKTSETKTNKTKTNKTKTDEIKTNETKTKTTTSAPKTTTKTTKPATQTAAKSAAKSTVKSTVKTESKTAAKSKLKSETKSEANPELKTELKSEKKTPFRKSAGNPDTKTPRQQITEMPTVTRTIKPVPLSKLPVFPVSKKPDNRQNFNAIWEILQQLYPKPEVELDFETPWEVLAATILSAQCTDRQVNTVTKVLFKKYRTLEDYANADPAEFGKDIYSTGFFNSKTKHIIGSANMILTQYNGQVPDTMEELTKLPGVGRKTANIVLSRGFGINDGIAVDTHVKRLTNKIGLTEHDDPEKIEQDLMKLAERKDYNDLSLTLIFHGRRVCDAKKPRCDVCAIQDMCPSAFM